MITNNFLIKLKERNSENISKTKDVLLSMQGKIDCLLDVKVEEDMYFGPVSYDLILITQFASKQDWDDFIIHPVHVEVSKYIANVLDSGASVCYES